MLDKKILKIQSLLETQPEKTDEVLELLSKNEDSFDRITFEKVRNKNESFEHFLLKEVGRVFLKSSKKCNYISTEVDMYRYTQVDNFPSKKIADVVGVKNIPLYHSGAFQLIHQYLRKFEKHYAIKGIFRFEPYFYLDVNCPIEKYQALRQWLTSTNEKERFEQLISEVIQQPKTLFVVEAKATYSDFKNGFCNYGDYIYLFAPIGVIPKDEVPSHIGLVEVDLEALVNNDSTNNILNFTRNVKRVKKKKTEFSIEDDLLLRKQVLHNLHERSTNESLYNKKWWGNQLII